MIIDCISDLHGYFPQLEGGDLLIVAGDLTARDTQEEHLRYLKWLNVQQYEKVIFIAGNHDNYYVDDECYCEGHIKYVCNSVTEFRGLKIWGSPHSLWFDGVNPACTAFMGSEEELAAKYALIPDDIDILISHTPMWGMLDQNRDGYLCGSRSLRDAVDRVMPKLLVCGHIHEQGGNELMYKHPGPNTWCVNASYVNEHYEPVNKPIRIEL